MIIKYKTFYKRIKSSLAILFVGAFIGAGIAEYWSEEVGDVIAFISFLLSIINLFFSSKEGSTVCPQCGEFIKDISLESGTIVSKDGFYLEKEENKNY